MEEHNMEKELSEYEAELHELKTVKRQEVRRKIEKAREKGDLAENYDYDMAKDEQSDVEARICELEKILEKAKTQTAPDEI